MTQGWLYTGFVVDGHKCILIVYLCYSADERRGSDDLTPGRRRLETVPTSAGSNRLSSMLEESRLHSGKTS